MDRGNPHFSVLNVSVNVRATVADLSWASVTWSRTLVYQPHLQSAFREHLGTLFRRHGWRVDPEAWTQKWGVHIQEAGSGATALKYLGAYVARTAIADSRVIKVDEREVTFWWKDREDGNRRKIMTLPGVEFVGRYLRHVLPVGLRSVRYYGFCHPAAKANRLRVQFHTGMAVSMGKNPGPSPVARAPAVCCSQCGRPMRLVLRLSRRGVPRGPPAGSSPPPHTSRAA